MEIIEKKQGYALLTFQGPITIYQVKDLREEILPCTDKYDRLALDLSGVDDCDSAGVQLLYSVLKTVEEKGGKISVKGASTEVRKALERSCLDTGGHLFSQGR